MKAWISGIVVLFFIAFFTKKEPLPEPKGFDCKLLFYRESDSLKMEKARLKDSMRALMLLQFRVANKKGKFDIR